MAPKSSPSREFGPLLETVLDGLYAEYFARRGVGRVADYIPALAAIPSDHFGVAVQPLQGGVMGRGDSEMRFSIQSVSKLFTFALAFSTRGKSVWERVGKEPSGAAFNALFQLEAEGGMPRNPFINPGAMVISDMLLEDYDDPMGVLLGFIHRLTGDASIAYDETVYRSERDFGSRNAAMAYLMKSFGNIRQPVERVLSFYFKQCSIAMDCCQLAQSIQFLANGGINPLSGVRILTASQTKRTNALLLTTGLYNEAGEFAFRVGMPAKSGVGGGIVALIPGVLTLCTWSPGLNQCGNSQLGIDFLEEFTTRTGLSIF